METQDLKITNILRINNIRITPQRIEVYKILLNENKHLSVEEIYKKVKDKFPNISLSTAYSILELFQKKRLAKEVRIQFDRICFELRRDNHHHHLFCRKCRRIFDLDITPCPALKKKEVNGHLLDELHGYFYGICKDCRKKGGKSERKDREDFR
ncbi:MAG: transcriptional repressor [Candidatus Omnitrophica bacterium]|nr:transcriptional repressor [Candidatus Omnitrophota bacterium]MCM8826772.1 transcriptional repressor [Candidatus Omnitrophota bacterium]